VAAEDGSDRLRVALLHVGDVQTQLKARAPPRNPHHAVAEDLLGQCLAVGGGGNRDAGVGVQMVDVVGVDQPCIAVLDGRRRRRDRAACSRTS
jgi:hypothetical protein